MVAAARYAGGNIDLPPEMQRELRALEARGGLLTYYELLGVVADADGSAIRRAYLEKSKRFHPDAWYRKELGEYGPLLNKWFQRLATAYHALSDEDTRADYDAEARGRLTASERKAVELRQLSRAEEERRQRERRERLLHTKGFARIGAARKLYEEAAELAEKGERTSAIYSLKAARELDPNRREIANKLIELERQQVRARAKSAIRVAKDREDNGKLAEALAAYTSAFQLDPNSFDAASGCARCAMAAGDAQLASGWAAKAVDLQPEDAAARFVLARAFAKLNLKHKARAELILVLDKEPEHKEARALLRAL